jgi:hypothetical protein
MPQPFYKLVKGRFTKMEMGPEKVNARPKLALQAFSVISHWAAAESALAQVAVSIVGGRQNPVIEFFSGLTSDSLKMAALKTLAMSHLAPDRFEVFTVLLDLYATAQALRNPIAHGMWGICETMPDALLVIDTRDKLKLDGNYDRLERQLDDAKMQKKPVEEIDAICDQMNEQYTLRMKATMVYRNKDFGAIIREIRTVYGFLTHFNHVVERDHMAPIFGSQQLFQWLVRQPVLRTRIQFVRSRAKGGP